MTDHLLEQFRTKQWIEAKASVEFYEKLQADAERIASPDARSLAKSWAESAAHWRREVQLIEDNMPTREQRMAGAA